jgi:glycosyltransferase involved in cell wall biosynthesis
MKQQSEPTVLLSANSFWNIAHFRQGLIAALAGAGHNVHVAAPYPDRRWAGERGIKTTDLAIDRSGLNPLRDGALLLNYVSLIRRIRPRFYLGFTAKPNIYGNLACRLCRVPGLPNVSGLGTAFIDDGPLSTLVGWLYRIAFRACPIVFFQNSEDRDLFIERRIVRADQARLLPGSGVDLDRFEAVPPPANQHPSFLFIGRLLGDKGVREFVEAARLLRQDHPDWRFLLLGSIDPGNRTGIAAEELGRWTEEGVVEHLGQLDDIRPAIAAADAVVLPSYREGMPRSLLEAAAMARPLIATDVPGNRQLVTHQVNGLLCKARDPVSLAEAMHEVGTMAPERRRAMGNAARATVEREFGEERVISAYLAAIAQLAQATGV